MSLLGYIVRFRKRKRPFEKPFCEQMLGNCESCNGPTVRVLLTTQPKAGTYLVAEALRQAGFHNTYLHLSERRLQAYDSRYLMDGLRNPRKFDVICGINESRKLIRSGELAASHLRYSSKLEKLLAGFKIVHIKRELRSSIVSWARMLLHSERFSTSAIVAIRDNGAAGLLKKDGERMIEHALSINQWSACSNVLSWKMENMLSQPTEFLHAVLKHVGISPQSVSADLWGNVLRSPTLTASTNYPALAWTEEDEKVFRKLGGPEANRLLGYLE